MNGPAGNVLSDVEVHCGFSEYGVPARTALASGSTNGVAGCVVEISNVLNRSATCPVVRFAAMIRVVPAVGSTRSNASHLPSGVTLGWNSSAEALLTPAGRLNLAPVVAFNSATSN